MKKLTHADSKGKAVMVDVGKKPVQRRKARAEGSVRLAPQTLDLIRKNQLKKGDVLTVAQLAGINAAKETGHLIPLCHNIVLESINVALTVEEDGIAVESGIACSGKTGAEMEALTAVSVALLTIYDMCKAVDRNMVIGNIKLIEKSKK